MNKEVTIIVNGRPKIVPKEEISFEKVVELAYPEPPYGDNTLFSITYRKGQGNKEGILSKGEFVKVKEGMIFDVTPTDKS